MAQPPLRYHCKDCGLNFDSGNSLDVHLQYHKENLLIKWGTSSAEESNNNHVNVKPSKSPRVAAVPADSSDSVMDRFSPNFNFPLNRATPPNSYHYAPADMRPPSVGQGDGGSRPNSNFNPNAEPDYILGGGSGFPHRRSPGPSSPSPHMLQTAASFRFHPYQQPQPQPVYGGHGQEQRNGGGVTSSSPGLMAPAHHRCDKCGFACDSPTLLLEHIQTAHPPSPPESFAFSNDFLRHQDQKNEPQAEILDLDSHKVHVYQPPQGDENSESSQLDPGLVPWLGVGVGMHDKLVKYHHVHAQAMQQMNGSGMPSPDFNVTTTTLNSPDIPHHQSYQYEHHIGAANQLPPQITSSQLPLLTPKPNMQMQGGKGSGNASWKSNEARRPKTYNCTACNKWFTSSGHLKRHYNTTLHKNAVKQSGIPDPANHPVSNHHHPPKEPPQPPPPPPPYLAQPQPQPQDSPPTPTSLTPVDEGHMMAAAAVKLEEGNFDRPQQHLANNGHNFLSSPPNSLAGPSEVTGGLLLHSTQFQTGQEEMRVQPTPPHIQQHQTFLPFPGAPHHTYPQGMTMYPNWQPPHVSSIPIVTNSITGNLNVLEQTVDLQQIWGRNGELRNQLIALAAPTGSPQPQPLPSFSQFAPNYVSFPQAQFCDQQSESTSDSNVGGLSPARVSSVDSFYPSPGPGTGYDITNVHSLEDPMSPSGETCDSDALPVTENSDFGATYPSPDTALPSSSTSEEERPMAPIEQLVIKEEPACSVSSTVERPSTPPIRCEDCDKKFNKACYLTQHNKSFHNGDRPYKCEKCGKRFEGESQRLVHLTKHLGEKPFKCEICPKQFNHKTDLRRHLCLHSGEKPFCCNICGKGFIRKDHMVKHCETHRKKHSGLAVDQLYSASASAKLSEPPLPVAHLQLSSH